MKPLYQFLIYAVFTVSLCLVLGTKGCEPYPTPTSQQPSFPVQDNFEHEKIWTEADFKQAEIDPLDVNHAVIAPHLPPPDDITEEDLHLIAEHSQKQLQRLVAGAEK